MQGILWGILALLGAILVSTAVVLWYRWTIFLHYREGNFLVEMRGFGLRIKIFQKDFSKKKQELPKSGAGSKQTSKKKAKKKEESKTCAFAQRWEKDKKKIYDKENGGYQPGGLSQVLREYRELYRKGKEMVLTFLEDTRHRIEISSLQIRLEFGTGNPAHTGMLYGTLWNVVGLGYPFLVRYFKAAYPQMEVTPDFYHPRFRLEIKSIIKVRPAHIINAVLKQVCREAITYVKQYFTKGSGKNG